MPPEPDPSISAAHIESPIDDVAGAPILESERRMSAMDLVLVLTSVALAAVGQLLLRHGMQSAKKASVAAGNGLVSHAVASPYVIGGLAIFGVSAVVWLAALSRVPLSRAYPFNAVTYVGILLAARFGLHEEVSPMRWFGATLVVTGLLLVVRS
jgi:drug/metabolite transporter (DMT)-like permease